MTARNQQMNFIHPFKLSPKGIDLKRKIDALVKQKRFEEAQQMKLELEKLERKCRKTGLGQQQTKLQNERRTLEQKQEAEESLYRQKHKTHQDRIKYGYCV